MDFGTSHEGTVDLRNKGRIASSKNSREWNSKSGFQSILERSRLTDEDLEEFRLNIQKAHKKKHYKVLMLSALLFISLGLITLYFLS